jgi:hypothetical protein
MAGVGDTELTQAANTADDPDLKKPSNHGTLRKMIASGKSIPSKACTK